MQAKVMVLQKVGRILGSDKVMSIYEQPVGNSVAYVVDSSLLFRFNKNDTFEFIRP
jgi:hypothetical protein